jgi:hypothetical protein
MAKAQNAMSLDSMKQILLNSEKKVTNIESEINNLKLNLRRIEIRQNSFECYINNDDTSELNVGFDYLNGILFEVQNGYLLFDGGYSGFDLTRKVTLFDSLYSPKAVYHFNNGKLIAVSLFVIDNEIIIEKTCLIYRNTKNYNFGVLNLNELYNIGFAEKIFFAEQFAYSTNNVYSQELGLIEFKTKYLIQN